jgi:CheY-like chemotaxis protein
LKTNFLAAMSHELRTPLNSIIGFSRVILKGIDGPLTEMQEQDIQTIHDSGKHLLGLVNDILDQAKIEAGKMELDYNYFDLKQVVDSVMASAIGLTRDKPIRLFTEVDENIPQAYGDEFRTRQILFNLISNASKFTNEGSITVGASSIHDRDGNEHIEVRVTDTGIGIAEENFDRLFESFQQVDNSTTRAAEGTGLGLPLSRSLARLQGGELWVASEVGTGSTFFVSIPIEPTSPEDEITSTGQFKAVVAETSAEPNGSNGHQTQAEAETEDVPDSDVPVESPVQTSEDIPQGRTILAVDDDEEVIALYQRYLRREGWYVVGTTDPEDVENKISQYRPEIVLLDINMPNRSGWQVLEDLKSNEATRDTPVIVCSIDDNTTRSENMGAAKHLMKPFIEGDLIKAVRTVEKKPEL